MALDVLSGVGITKRLSTPLALIRTLRMHQWVKNLLVLVPLLLAFKLSDAESVRKAFLAFVAFNLCASGAYLINDLVDADHDRVHPVKRKRPIASGQLPWRVAAAFAPLLFLAASLIGMAVNSYFLASLLTYFVVTSLYSFLLKRVAVADVICLASLYTWRIFAGSLAIQVPLTAWLLAFSMFLFLSLALAKRVAELTLAVRSNLNLSGRGYQNTDVQQLASLGGASGYVAILVLALYLNSEQVVHLYKYSQLLWFLCPLFLYWVSRLWLLAHRGELHTDPIIFAIKDQVSYGIGLASLLIWLIARGAIFSV